MSEHKPFSDLVAQKNREHRKHEAEANRRGEIPGHKDVRNDAKNFLEEKAKEIDAFTRGIKIFEVKESGGKNTIMNDAKSTIESLDTFREKFLDPITLKPYNQIADFLGNVDKKLLFQNEKVDSSYTAQAKVLQKLALDSNAIFSKLKIEFVRDGNGAIRAKLPNYIDAGHTHIEELKVQTNLSHQGNLRQWQKNLSELSSLLSSKTDDRYAVARGNFFDWMKQEAKNNPANSRKAVETNRKKVIEDMSKKDSLRAYLFYKNLKTELEPLVHFINYYHYQVDAIDGYFVHLNKVEVNSTMPNEERDAAEYAGKTFLEVKDHKNFVLERGVVQEYLFHNPVYNFVHPSVIRVLSKLLTGTLKKDEMLFDLPLDFISQVIGSLGEQTIEEESFRARIEDLGKQVYNFTDPSFKNDLGHVIEPYCNRYPGQEAKYRVYYDEKIKKLHPNQQTFLPFIFNVLEDFFNTDYLKPATHQNGQEVEGILREYFVPDFAFMIASKIDGNARKEDKMAYVDFFLNIIGFFIRENEVFFPFTLEPFLSLKSEIEQFPEQRYLFSSKKPENFFDIFNFLSFLPVKTSEDRKQFITFVTKLGASNKLQDNDRKELLKILKNSPQLSINILKFQAVLLIDHFLFDGGRLEKVQMAEKLPQLIEFFKARTGNISTQVFAYVFAALMRELKDKRYFHAQFSNVAEKKKRPEHSTSAEVGMWRAYIDVLSDMRDLVKEMSDLVNVESEASVTQMRAEYKELEERFKNKFQELYDTRLNNEPIFIKTTSPMVNADNKDLSLDFLKDMERTFGAFHTEFKGEISKFDGRFTKFKANAVTNKKVHDVVDSTVRKNPLERKYVPAAVNNGKVIPVKDEGLDVDMLRHSWNSQAVASQNSSSGQSAMKESLTLKDGRGVSIERGSDNGIAHSKQNPYGTPPSYPNHTPSLDKTIMNQATVSKNDIGTLSKMLGDAAERAKHPDPTIHEPAKKEVQLLNELITQRFTNQK